MVVRDPDPILRRGLEHFRAGRMTEAEAAFREVLAVQPDNPNGANLLGLVRRRQGQPAEAEAWFRKAIRAYPEAGGFHNNLGSALLQLGRPDEALAAFREALRLEPGNPDATLNLTKLLRVQGDPLAALPHLDRALRGVPNDGDLLAQKGEILAACGDGGGALDCLRRAAALAPGSAPVWSALGWAQLQVGDGAAAVQALARSLALDGAQPVTGSALLMAHQYAGELSPEALADLHRQWGRRFCPPRPARPWTLTREPERRLRVGLLSPDLRSHSVGAFLKGLLQAADPDRIRFVAYACSQLAGDASPTAFRPHFESWREVGWMATTELANLIQADQVDILIDLAGHTAGGRLDVSALRPAPLQVFWLGYPGSTGSEAFQGRLTDAWVDPPGEEARSSEPPLRLSRGFHCYTPPPASPEPGDLPARAGHGFTFASFNTFAKLTPEVVRVWAAILQRVPGSRLLLKSNRVEDPYPVRRLHGLFQGHGVDPGRVEVLGRLEDKAEHLAQYQQVDLALDPFPYNGVTTTCEALWMGVPVLCLHGDRPAGRYGASLLHQAGLAEFLAPDLDAYQALAQAWTEDLPRLAELRRSLRPRLLGSALLDARGFALQFEAALRELWRGWCAGGPGALG